LRRGREAETKTVSKTEVARFLDGRNGFNLDQEIRSV
jgi:hypothetical protein